MSLRLRPFAALVRKDLRVFMSDKRSVILAFVAPLVLASVFASMTSGAADGGSKIPVLVADDDQGTLTRKVVAALSADPNLAVSETTTSEARGRVHAGEANVAVLIPRGFGASAGKGFFGSTDKPEITFLTDPTHAAEAGMVRGLFTQHAIQETSRDAFSGPGGLVAMEEAEHQIDKAEGVPFPLRQALKVMFRDVKRVREQTPESDQAAAASFGFTAPFIAHEETVAAKGQVDHAIMAAHSFAGMAVQFILFASVEAGVGLLTERQKGLWRRLRAAPVSKGIILGSKAVSQTLIALAILLVLFGFGAIVFHVRFSGSLAGFALVAIAYALTASTFGLLIAALGKTPQAARGISVMTVLFMVLLGGAWVPMFLFPEWLQKATLAMPTRWAVDGFEGATWRGLSFLPLATKAAALFAFAALFATLAVARFRWEEE